MQRQPTASNLGIGPDFILFDDAPRVSGSSQSGSSTLMPMATPGAEWSSAWGSGSSQIEVPSLRAFTGVSAAGGLTMPAAGAGVSARPSMGESNASFTQYRAPSTNATGAMQQQQQPESPFSSPASRPDDDFGVGATINPKSGAPNRKRARPAGYSSSGGGGGSSSSGWGHTRMLSQGSLGSQGSAADWISEASSTSPHAPTNGFAAMQQPQHRMTQQGSNGKGVDWLSDTSVSPQQPPSGSFGPPIQSLNLGDAGPSLFPGSGAAPTSEAEAAQARALFALSLSNSNPNIAAPTSAASYQPGQGVDWTSTVPGAAVGAGGVAQADRVRQQVRADLMGVDPRALKGPLRDIQQGGAQALRQGGGSGRPEARPVAPRRRSGSLDSAMPVAMPDMSWMQWQGPTFAQATPSGAPAMETTQSWDGTPTQQFSTQLSSYLDAFAGGQPLPQLNAQHAQHAQQQQQQQVQQQRRSSLQVGHADGRPRMSRDRSGLTVSPHETLLDWDASNGRAFSLFPGLSDSLVGRVRATAAVPTPKRAPLDRNETARPSPQQQAAMAHQQQQHKQQQQQQHATRSEAQSSSQQSSGSLFSPTSAAAFGGETPSSEEEDEARLSTSTSSAGGGGGGATKSKGFNVQAPAVASSLAGAGIINGHAHTHAHAHGKSSKSDFPFPPQQAQGLHVRTAGGTHNNGGVGVGPRFGDVSSSSSEDEGDSARGRRGGTGAMGDAHVQRQRQQGMGGYGYMAGSAESGLSVVAPGFLSVPDSTSSGGGASGATTENAAEARRRSDSQSNDDDGGASPSIRSSAQAIPAPQRVAQAAAATEQGASHTPRQRSVSRARASGAQASGDDEGEWEEEEEEDADDGSDEGSDYEGGATTTRNAAGNSGARKRRRRPKGASSASTTNAASSSSASSGVPRLAAGLPKATNAPSSSGMHSATNAAGITTCDYVSKATHEYCGTEFHRPYDLARHRETIHGKEEAQLLRLGKIKKEDCAVLYREVDPAKSLATVEWKCDGKNGCGSVFSRKDALLRHRRIRAHGK